MFSVENLPEKYLISEEEDAPVLVVFFDTEHNSLCNYIIGDDTKMFGQTINIIDKNNPMCLIWSTQSSTLEYLE
jgi:hypothetical protein